MLTQLRSGELTVTSVGYQLGLGVGSSYERDTLILFRLLGFDVNFLNGPPQLGALGPVVYALNEISPPSSLVIRCRFGAYVVSLLHHGQDLRWDLLRV